MQFKSFGVCPDIYHNQPTSRSSEQKRTFSSSLASHQWWLFGRQEWFILYMPLSLVGARLDGHLYFNILRTEKYSKAMCYNCHRCVTLLPTYIPPL